MPLHEYPSPPFLDLDRAAEVWRVPYEIRASEARQWATEHHIQQRGVEVRRKVISDVIESFPEHRMKFVQSPAHI